jgi:hypothetical protein
MFLNTIAMFEIIAPLNPEIENDTSFIAAIEQPITIGIKLAHTAGEYVAPNNGPLKITENTGSAALITCVNDTAILENETHAETWPTMWKNATGNTAIKNALDTFGFS